MMSNIFRFLVFVGIIAVFLALAVGRFRPGIVDPVKERDRLLGQQSSS